MKSLRISPTLSLPLNYATKTAAILAQRRKGKTYTASVIAEEMVHAKQPFVALDPTGAWWGLRASADGKSAGLPVIILGGQHGDVALERTGGRVVADLVVDEPGFYVIDFSLFESGEAERQFAVDFAERLYRAKAQPGKNFPLHLFVDEADRFIPQNLSNKTETSARLLGAFEAIVRRGGLRGLGTTLISQRAAVVNKNVLEMLDVLFALRTLGPNDQKAIKGYVSAHGSDAELAAISGSLASLAIGEAWVWEPGAEPALFERVKIRQRETFNSSATPDATHRPVDPKQLAAVDLQALNKRMAATIERAKADDPKQLRQRIVELERDLRKSQANSLPTGKPPEDRKQTVTEILTDADRELLRVLQADFATFSEDIGAKADLMLTSFAERAKLALDQALNQWTTHIDHRRELFAKRLEGARVQRLLGKIDRVVPAPIPIKPMSDALIRAVAATSRPPQLRSPAAHIEKVNGTRVDAAGLKLKKGCRDILAALGGRHPNAMSWGTIGLLCGIKATGSTLSSYMSNLRTAGLIEEQGDLVTLTPAGLALAGDGHRWTADELYAIWAKRLKRGARQILDDLMKVYPKTRSKADLGDLLGGIAAGGSTLSSYLSKLRTAGLITERGTDVSASEELFR